MIIRYHINRFKRLIENYGYTFINSLNKTSFNLSYHVEVEGLEKIPNGPYLMLAKHEKFLDPLVLHKALNEPYLHTFTRKEFFTWYKRLFFVMSGCIPVDRFDEDRRLNLRAIIYAADELIDGRPLLVFPEKHRHPKHIGHLHLEGPILIDRRIKRKSTDGRHIPLLFGSLHYEDDEHATVRYLINPLNWLKQKKPLIRVKFGGPLYTDDYVSDMNDYRHGEENEVGNVKNVITKKAVEEFQGEFGYEYLDDEPEKCPIFPLRRK